MLKTNFKAVLALLGMAALPLMAQEDGSAQDANQTMFKSGEKIKNGQLPGAYSQNAGYMCNHGWDVAITADYIYWDWVQDQEMNISFNGLSVFSVVGSNFDAGSIAMTPGYASGFQVGAGFNMKGMDDWNFYSEYTWYKNSETDSRDLVENAISSSITSSITGSTHISIKYDNADFLLQRHFYLGKKLMANFSTGIKALWITNDVDKSVTGSLMGDNGYFEIDIDTFTSQQTVSSWGLGPKFGFDSTWLLGYGIKLLANISTSVLYTSYTGSYDQEVEAAVTILGMPFDPLPEFKQTISNYGTLRPVVETFLGLGWGSYFWKDKFHVDLSAGYDFNVHWNYITPIMLLGYADSSNLYLHGLNAQLRFDF